MKRFATAVALALVFSSSALAGDIPCGSPSPAPNGTTQTTSSTAPGDIPSVGSAEQLSSTALSALLAVLGLLSV
jgi:hypothetical protein